MEDEKKDPIRVHGGLGQLSQDFNTMKSRYAREQKKMRILDAIMQGDMWRALGAKFPKYQILPDTNDVAYIVNNMVASVYSVSKIADILPTSEQDMQIINDINMAVEHEWQLAQIPQAQRRAGHNAALFNLGITQVGWDDDLRPNMTTNLGGIKVRNIHPLKFMRDPFAANLDEAGYCCTYEKHHKSTFLSNPLYRERFEDFIKTQDSASTLLPSDTDSTKIPSSTDAYYNLIVFWYKVKDGNRIVIDEYHTIDGKFLLHHKHDIKPSVFPFALLYCNDPMDSIIGNSEPARAVPNSVASNIMDSENLTNAYRKMHPVKFASANSGLNLNSFAEHANDADYTFVVQGDAQKAVHYADYPDIDQTGVAIQTRLKQDIDRVSGVDGRYTGRNTGSVTTTGGMQEMIDRMTLIDVPKIDRLEDYTKKLTELVLRNLLEFAPKRVYLIPAPNTPLQKQKYTAKYVDFPSLTGEGKNAVFGYQVHVSADLPKNRQRIAEMANQLMEKQMQYKQAGQEVDLITPEEWLRLQDIPIREQMLERMGLQRQSNAVEDTSQVLFEYAELTKQGMDPEEAMLAVANSLNNKRQGLPTDATQLQQMGIPTAGAGDTFPSGFGPAPQAGTVGENMPLV
jgi:hypothetical protein